MWTKIILNPNRSWNVGEDTFQYLAYCSQFYEPICFFWGGVAAWLGQPWKVCWIKIETISRKGHDSDKTFWPGGEAQGYYLPDNINFEYSTCFYLLLGSGLQCCHSEHLLHILCCESFLLRDLRFLHSDTWYMSVLGCCCSGKIHIYCPPFPRVYMRGGGNHCHPDTAAAATHPMGASVSFSECSFLIMIKNLVTVSN